MLTSGGRRFSVFRHFIHTSTGSCWSSKVDKATLSKLRKKTGFPFVKCKNALVQFENNLPQAEEWLRKQAQKEGWAKATKLEGRPMSQGLIGVILEKNKAVMVEVNCETDFVARNTKFQKLVAEVAKSCLNHGAQTEKTLLSKEEVNSLPVTGGANTSSSLSDLVALEVGNIGENMAIRRAALFNVKPTDQLGYYIHSSGPQNFKEGSCMMGKYGAIVSISQSTASNVDQQLQQSQSAASNIGHELCQHIVGMNPSSLGTEEDKPARKKDNETLLIHQEFLMDPTVTVREYLIQNAAVINDYVRYQCGEVIEEKAAEATADDKKSEGQGEKEGQASEQAENVRTTV